MPRPLPSIESLLDLEQADIAEPAPIIDNLLEQGSKLMLVSTSKGHKTWNLLMMSCCVARPANTWLGLKVHQTKVLFINFEIQRFFFRKRIRAIAEATKAPMSDFKDIDFWNLRGCSQNERSLVEAIKLRLKDNHRYGMIVVDPYYKFSGGGKVENSAEDVASVMRALDEVTVDLEVAVAYSHHTPKGDISERAVVDRGSGSGVFGRDPDAIMSISEIKGTPGHFIAEFALRNHPPLAPIGLRWEFPFMRHDTEVELLKKGRKKIHNRERLLGVLPDEPITSIDMEKLAEDRLDIKRSTCQRLRQELVQNSQLEVVGKSLYRKTFFAS